MKQPARKTAPHDRPDGPKWLLRGHLDVTSGGLSIADLCLVPNVKAFLHVPVQNGRYAIEVAVADIDGRRYISHLGARLEGTNPRLGSIHGKVGVDIAKVVLGDFTSMLQGLSDDEIEELGELTDQFMRVECELCSADFESKTVEFIVCRTGFGDGTYPVRTLLEENHVVGVEIEFISADRYVEMTMSDTWRSGTIVAADPH